MNNKFVDGNEGSNNNINYSFERDARRNKSVFEKLGTEKETALMSCELIAENKNSNNPNHSFDWNFDWTTCNRRYKSVFEELEELGNSFKKKQN